MHSFRYNLQNVVNEIKNAMTKILKSISIPSKTPNTEVWCEKYWEHGFAKPLWRWGKTIYDSNNNVANCYAENSHLLTKPKIERFR